MGALLLSQFFPHIMDLKAAEHLIEGSLTDLLYSFADLKVLLALLGLTECNAILETSSPALIYKLNRSCFEFFKVNLQRGCGERQAKINVETLSLDLSSGYFV